MPASLIVCFMTLNDGVAAGCGLKEYAARRGASSSSTPASKSERERQQSTTESESDRERQQSTTESESERERQSTTDKALALSSESDASSSV